MSDDPKAPVVLIVDDDEGARRIAAEILRRSGYTVLQAAAGTEAISVSWQHDGALDLLLTDIVLPGMNGVQLASRIADQRPGIAVVFMSGRPEVDAVRYGVLAPSYPFLPKPYGVDELLAIVRAALPAGAP
ncbi:MAG TPA: response regulator [Longimicrobium sp.]|jgi:DNA-binding NtrC family response regulator